MLLLLVHFKFLLHLEVLLYYLSELSAIQQNFLVECAVAALRIVPEVLKSVDLRLTVEENKLFELDDVLHT